MDKKLIHTLFEHCSEQYAQKVAIETGSANYTYAQVNEMANQLASLIQQYAGKDDVVATYAKSEVIYIFAVLATFKAGAVYLPLDKKYNKNHWQSLFETIQPKVLLIERDYIDDFEHYNSLFDYNIPTLLILSVNQDGIALHSYKNHKEKEIDITKRSKQNLNVPLEGEDSNSIFFTSGSTGFPKAILGQHKSLGHFINWQTQAFNISPDDRLGQLTSFSFDASLRDIFLPLANGATICIPDQETRMNIIQLAQWFRAQKITLTHTVPTFFRLIISEDTAAEPFALRYLFLAGEKVYNKDIINWQKKYGLHTAIVNFYGATESTLIKTFHVVDQALNGNPSNALSVGKPISNTAILILNNEKKLCRAGEKGEVYIQTPFLSKGYFNNPEATSECFIQNPLIQEKEIIYKTGDYGKYDHDWNTTILGRIDSMVKLNGVRIDLNAIEKTIINKQEINGVKCILHTQTEPPRLLCFYTTDSPIDQELQEYCEAHLSAYEQPSAFFYLEKFPVNANGKIDKNALEASLDSFDLIKKEQVQLTEFQQSIADIWRTVLNIDTIHPKDSFFKLGGQSISVMKLITAYQKDFEVELSYKEIFENPTLASQENLIRTGKSKGFKNILRTEHTTKVPLSFSQRNMWIACQVTGSEVYNMPAFTKLYFHDDEYTFFEKAVLSVIQRHEILRTVFRKDGDEPYQIVIPYEAFNFTINHVDFSGSDNAEEKAKDHIRRDAYVPFDLENGPLIRAEKLKIGEDHFIFYYNMHHLISDVWSMDILIRDILAYYRFYKGEAKLELSELRIQYKDYSVWQWAQLETKAFEGHKKYWLEKLSGDLPILDLPGYKQRPLLKTYQGQRLEVYWGKENTAAIQAYVREKRGTLFMFLLASLKVLFYRYTGQENLIIGSPIAGREHSDLEDQIGFYVNTLALRSKVAGRMSFDDFFEQLKQDLLNAYAHQVYPFDQLVEDLDLSRNTSRSSLFDVLLVLQNTVEAKEIQEVLQEDIDKIRDCGTCMSKFDLSFTFAETGDHIRLELIYNTEVYDKTMVTGLIDHYQQLLKNIVKDSSASLNEFEYLSESEKSELLYDLNDTEVFYPKEKTVLDLFNERVVQIPDSTAVVFEDEKLTYQELNECSNQLANYLRDQYTIMPNDLVGIKLERSHWTIISILSILKSGGAYLPIDPDYPQERMDYMISDSNCKVLIDQQELEKFVKNKKQYQAHNLESLPKPDDLAYVIYTSGSTGTPKGTLITHKNLNVRICYMIDAYDFDDKDRSFFYRSFSFDGSIEEYLLPVLSGAKCYIAAPDFKENMIEQIIFQIEKNKITKLNAPPALLNEIVRHFNENKISIDSSSLKHLVSGGDKLSTSIAEQCLKLFPNTLLHNTYGPTECTIDSTHLVMDKDFKSEVMTIGYPIPNTQVYILDNNEKLLPKAAIGEICIGGDGLAKGYLNRPDLTSEKFRPHPFKQNALIYKTGDIGRWRSDGSIEFMGRKDDQVKVRGYRIELGDIENALLSKNEIENVVVLAKASTSGDKNLVAYYNSSEPVEVSDLRSHLLERLPAYMVPGYFVPLAEFPLTSNGKIDKKALPDPEDLGLSSGVEYVAPRTETEKLLIAIWELILERKPIGVKDDFFALGGQSLKAIRLISEYHKVFEIKLSIGDVFLNTSLESHARLIASSEKNKHTKIPLLPQTRDYFVSDVQRRLWVLSQFENSSVAYNMPNYIMLKGEYDISNFKRSIWSVLERHEILRTVFREGAEGIIRQVVLDLSELEFDINYKNFSQKDKPEQFALEYIREDAYQPFDLENGPLLRVSLLQLNETKYFLYYNMHHLISDGWSMDILSRDIFSYYKHYSKGAPLALPELRIQYKDYAAWQLEQAKTKAYKTHREYWLKKLSGALPVLDLPANKQRPVLKTPNGHLLNTWWSKEDTFAIRNYIHEKGGTLFMFLLASLKTVFYHYTGEKDIIIGTAVAGRDHSDLKDQIGCYINTLALRSEISGDIPFDKFYEQVRQDLLDAYTHQMYPFDRLVEELKLNRDTSRSALFDVMILLQNTADIQENPNIPTEEIAVLKDCGATVSKFDLLFDFIETVDHLGIGVTYNTDVYDYTMIADLMNHYLQLIRGVVVNSNASLGKLAYLTESEKSQILHDFNATKVSYPESKTLIDLFEEQVRLNPEKVAIYDSNISYTYDDVKKKSDSIAAYLIQEEGDKKESIGVVLERSADLVVILLGILKSGKSYIPIDQNLPKDRIDYIVKNSKTKVVISNQAILQEGRSYQNINFIDSENLLTQKSKPKIDFKGKPLSTDTAYIIYTSGSTGNPKGVEIGHQALTNFLTSIKAKPGISETDILYAVTTYSFDISILEFFTPLIAGAAVFVATNEVLSDPDLIIENLETIKPTIIQATPSFYQMLFNAGWKGNRAIKILCGGDALSEALAKQLVQNSEQVWNMYGPTETTIWSTLKKIEKPGDASNIGQPLNNTQVYILNSELNLVPKGVSGKIFIGGDGLAKGYFENEALTEEKFIDNPFTIEVDELTSKTKIYNTGDVGRWLPDGHIEFLGRDDDQVKIRGYRIELGEIENVLRQYSDAIKQVVLKAIKIQGDKTLVAYYTADKELDKSAMKSYLSNKLPRYMVPGFFKALDSMPLTPNGKVNKRMLPEIADDDIIRNEFVQPQNEMEATMIDVIKREVGSHISRVGTTDNFFDLGLDSLSLLKILNQINSSLGLELKPLDLFQYPNVQSLINNVLKIETQEAEYLSNISEDMDSIVDMF